MMDEIPRQGSLVLYKTHPARVKQAGKKIEIELQGGEVVAVRPKDVEVLHPGPLDSLAGLSAASGEIQAAWELLAGSSTDLAELAELAFGAYTPATAWAAWTWVADGLYFQGTPEHIQARTAEEVAAELQGRGVGNATKQMVDTTLKRRVGKTLERIRDDGRWVYRRMQA